MPPKIEISTNNFSTITKKTKLTESPLLLQARRIFTVEGRYTKKYMHQQLIEAGVKLTQRRYEKSRIEEMFFNTFSSYFAKVASERQQNCIERLKCATKQKFDYIIVLDFECNCQSDSKISNFDFFEIIEFPAVIIDVQKRSIITDYFHRYVRPVRNEITPFCTQLTGISQDRITEHGISLQQALLEFHSWLTSKGVIDKRYAYAVDGQSDIGHFLQSSLKVNNLPFLHDFRRYIDVKYLFQTLGYSQKVIRLKRMLKVMNIQFEGNLHCGLNDAQNIAKIIVRLIEESHFLDYTHKLVPQGVQTINPDLGWLNSNNVFYNGWMKVSALRPISLDKTDILKGRAEWCDICGNFVCKQKLDVVLA